MSSKTTQSTFGSIRLTLTLVALGVTVGFYTLAQLFVAPRLVEDRAQAILSVIRSHERDIILNKTRSVRDELLNTRAITEDKQFSHYFSDEKDKISPYLSGCRFVAPTICLGESASIFFAPNSDRSPRDDFKFAIVLNNDLSRPPILLRLWEGVVAILTALAFWLIHRAIAKKERYLLSRLAVATTAFERARVLFADTKRGDDEFDAFGKSAEDLVRMLEDYKARYERKTRIEQLGLIVGQVSHDLKAPFNEAENFLNAMPLLLKSASHEELLEGTASLAKRIRSGKESINHAIQFAKRSTIAREEVSLADVFKSVQARTHLNTKLKEIFLSLSVPGEYQVLGDQIQLETAFVNLLENSADEKRNAKIEIDLSLHGLSTARITYTDNGGGIPEEFLEKIFEPLVTFKVGGTGFGLASTKEIFAVHGGSIRALPHRGGAKFEVLLPILGGANA